MLLALVMAALASQPPQCRAQAGGGDEGKSLDERDRIIQKLFERVETLEEQVQKLERSGEAGKTSNRDRSVPRGREPLSAEEMGGVTARGEAPPPGTPGPEPSAAAPGSTPAAPAATGGSPAPAVKEGESASPAAEPAPPEEERQVVRVPLATVERGGNLLRPGNIQLESALSYSHTQNTRLIVTGFSVIPLIILGTLESEKLTRDAWTPNFSARYGLIKDLQVDAGVPLSWQTHSRVRLSNDQVRLVQEDSSEFGVGDVQFGGTYQVLYERGWLPDVSYSLHARVPTGRSQFDIFKTISRAGPFGSVEDFVSRLNSEGLPVGNGFWGFTHSVSMVKALDPAILFGTVSYTYNVGRRVSLVEIDQEHVEGGTLLSPRATTAKLGPGDTIAFSLGFALAMNNQFSVNFVFSDAVTFSSKRNGIKIPDSGLNQAVFGAGFSLALTRRVVVAFQGNVGLTPDAPDVSFSLSVPVKFDSIKDLFPWKLGSLKNLFPF